MEQQTAAVATEADGLLASAPTVADHVDEEILGEILMVLEEAAPDGLMKACDLFRSGVAERFVHIDAALAEGRFEGAALASHSLRGSAGTFGARRLSALGEGLERLCRELDGPAAVLLVEEMRAEFLLFRAILDVRLAALSGAN